MRLQHSIAITAGLVLFALGGCQDELATDIGPASGTETGADHDGARPSARAESASGGSGGVAGAEAGPGALGGARSFTVVRGPDGVRASVGPASFSAQQEEPKSEETYWCDSPEECWNKCPEPEEDGGSTSCSCESMDGGDDEDAKEGQYWCTVTFYGPGEHPWEGGGGGVCGDERDALAAEYDDPSGWPCTKFVSSGRTANFKWSELNGEWAGGNERRHKPYGFVTSTLKTNLQATRDQYGAIRISSGYRCPDGNATLPKAVATSNHVKGMAVDMVGLAGPWIASEYRELMLRAFANGGTLPEGSEYRSCRAEKPGGTCGHLHMNFL